MAGNGYVTKGYSTYDEMEPTYKGYVCNDHVCRPIIVDAQGRKRPIIRYTDTTSGYPTRTPDYTYNNYGPGSINNDKLDHELITKVQTEATHYPTKTANTNYWQTTTTTTTPTYAYGYPNTITTESYESEWGPKRNHPLTTTTNDIGEAVDFLKHAITTEPHAQPRVHKKESYMVAETMDSSEAARRYARPVFKYPQSMQVGSREAVHKYD